MRLALFASVPILALGLAACAGDDSTRTDPGPQPTSLRDVTIAPDFTFAMTRAVTVRVKLAGTSAKTVPVEVHNTHGELLARGQLTAQRAYELDFPLPRAESSVVVKVAGDERHVAIHDGVAETTFN